MQEALTLCLERTIPHPPAAVYAAWTRSDMLKAWFRMAPGDRLLHAIAEPKPGGPFHFHLHRQNGMDVHYRGLYEEVQAEKRLCFSWPAYGKVDFPTRVEVDFAADEQACLLILLHDGLRDSKMQKDYRQGWSYCLDSLEKELPGILQRH